MHATQWQAGQHLLHQPSVAVLNTQVNGAASKEKGAKCLGRSAPAGWPAPASLAQRCGPTHASERAASASKVFSSV
jgi:hypothetical protein